MNPLILGLSEPLPKQLGRPLCSSSKPNDFSDQGLVGVPINYIDHRCFMFDKGFVVSVIRFGILTLTPGKEVPMRIPDEQAPRGHPDKTPSRPEAILRVDLSDLSEEERSELLDRYGQFYGLPIDEQIRRSKDLAEAIQTVRSLRSKGAMWLFRRRHNVLTALTVIHIELAEGNPFATDVAAEIQLNGTPESFARSIVRCFVDVLIHPFGTLAAGISETAVRGILANLDGKARKASGRQSDDAVLRR